LNAKKKGKEKSMTAATSIIICCDKISSFTKGVSDA
jgi:hypothetical protein